MCELWFKVYTCSVWVWNNVERVKEKWAIKSKQGLESNRVIFHYDEIGYI